MDVYSEMWRKKGDREWRYILLNILFILLNILFLKVLPYITIGFSKLHDIWLQRKENTNKILWTAVQGLVVMFKVITRYFHITCCPLSLLHVCIKLEDFSYRMLLLLHLINAILLCHCRRLHFFRLLMNMK
jgi:hypothetical protein